MEGPTRMPADITQPLAGGDLIFRHKLSTRLWHWVSAGMMLVLLMSGLMIFNAHPRLYWGSYGANHDPAWLEISAEDGHGYVHFAGRKVETTGILGVSPGFYGPQTEAAFPAWATLPGYFDPALARRWHLTTAWFLALGTIGFGLWSIANGHMVRDLLPTRRDLAPRSLGRTLWDHLRLRYPCGAEAVCYNVHQKLAYLGVTAGLIPAIILSGLTMSPWVTAAAPWLLDLFGGRQSARSVHFIAVALLVAFVLLHLALVLASGPLNGIRSMITGRFRLPQERDR